MRARIRVAEMLHCAFLPDQLARAAVLGGSILMCWRFLGWCTVFTFLITVVVHLHSAAVSESADFLSGMLDSHGHGMHVN